MKKQMTTFDKMKAMEKMGTIEDLPYYVWTFFNASPAKLEIFGDSLSIGSGDFKTLSEARKATEWIITQLGGEVKWK